MQSFSRRRTLQWLGATATVPLWPGAFAAEGPGGTLVLVEKEAPALSFYRLPGGEPLASLPMPEQPHEVVASADGRWAFVAQYGVAKWAAPGEGGHQVVVVDLSAQRIARNLDLTPYGRLHGIRMDAAGRLYVLSEAASVLIRFDNPAQDQYPSQIVPVGGTRSHYLVLSRDGRRAYVSDTLSGMVIMLDPHDPTFSPIKRLAGQAPEGACLSPDETVFYVIDRYQGLLQAFDAGTLAPRAQQRLRGEAVRVVALPDGRLVVANQADKSLSLLRPDTLAEERHLPLEAAAPGLNLAPGGHTLYASLESDKVAIIDIARWQISGFFPTRHAPDAAAVLPT
ncbi:twin-arginine translocation pathway signal protein [Pseudomonas typographi]|uniref:twin-arginine translocation pathway signal protein n=1 Tax=Pseudomonas typographi TaxID=2715964 RepID=UPI001689EC7B|nr:twin-arginine translocation pathway signal protein [Pseudomonas typographi]